MLAAACKSIKTDVLQIFFRAVNWVIATEFGGGVAITPNGMRPSSNQFSVDGGNMNVGLYNYPHSFRYRMPSRNSRFARATIQLVGGTVDPTNLERDRGLAGIDHRHHLAVSYICELPFGPGNTIGNSGRNIIIGPALHNWDIAILRRFSLYENHAVQFRADMFNAFNNVNLGTPGLGTPTFGQILTAGTARMIQLALKYNFSHREGASDMPALYALSLMLPAAGSACASSHKGEGETIKAPAAQLPKCPSLSGFCSPEPVSNRRRHARGVQKPGTSSRRPLRREVRQPDFR